MSSAGKSLTSRFIDVSNKCQVVNGCVLDVVEADPFRGAGRAFHPEKDFCWRYIVMATEVVRMLPGDPDLLCGMVGRGGPVWYSCGHHEQVNCEAEWALCDRLGSVGDTTFFFFSVGAGLLFQPSRSVEFAS